MKTTKRNYGWKVQLPDQRDHQLLRKAVKLPPRIDLRLMCPPVYDQGRIGSCTANAIAGALQFAQGKQGKPSFTTSRLFIYWNERSVEHTVALDAGANIRDGMKVVNKIGAPPEALWPYKDTPANPSTNAWKAKDAPRVKPNAAAFAAAALHETISYAAVDPTIAGLTGCLALGYPFVFGFSVYASFESAAVAKSGIVPMPAPKEAMLGGHAVLAVGYDFSAQRFIVRNSWGSGWGLAGYFTIPFGYLTNPNLAADFWAVNLVA